MDLDQDKPTRHEQKHIKVEQNANMQLVSLIVASEDNIFTRRQNLFVVIAVSAIQSIKKTVTTWYILIQHMCNESASSLYFSIVGQKF